MCPHVQFMQALVIVEFKSELVCMVIVQSMFCNSACIIYWYHISPGLVFRKQLIICLGILRSKVSPYLIKLNRQYCVVVYDDFYLRNVIIYADVSEWRWYYFLNTFGYMFVKLESLKRLRHIYGILVAYMLQFPLVIASQIPINNKVLF